MDQDTQTLSSTAYLSRNWTTVGAKPGTLLLKNAHLNFTDVSGTMLFEYLTTDITSVKHSATGWLYVKCRNGKKYKIAFYNVRPFPGYYMKIGIKKYGLFSGSLGTSMALTSAILEADKTAKLWERQLSDVLSPKP